MPHPINQRQFAGCWAIDGNPDPVWEVRMSQTKDALFREKIDGADRSGRDRHKKKRALTLAGGCTLMPG
jgi:hypothetical protein